MTPSELNALEAELFRATEQVRGSLAKMEHSSRNDHEIPTRYKTEYVARLERLRAVIARLDMVLVS